MAIEQSPNRVKAITSDLKEEIEKAITKLNEVINHSGSEMQVEVVAMGQLLAIHVFPKPGSIGVFTSVFLLRVLEVLDRYPYINFFIEPQSKNGLTVPVFVIF